MRPSFRLPAWGLGLALVSSLGVRPVRLRRFGWAFLVTLPCETFLLRAGKRSPRAQGPVAIAILSPDLAGTTFFGFPPKKIW